MQLLQRRMVSLADTSVAHVVQLTWTRTAEVSQEPFTPRTEVLTGTVIARDALYAQLVAREDFAWMCGAGDMAAVQSLLYVPQSQWLGCAPTLLASFRSPCHVSRTVQDKLCITAAPLKDLALCREFDGPTRSMFTHGKWAVQRRQHICLGEPYVRRTRAPYSGRSVP